MTDQQLYIHSPNGMYTMKVVNQINKHDPVYTAKADKQLSATEAVVINHSKMLSNRQHIADNMININHLININDLACNNITIETICEGSAKIITDPPGATIFIDGVRQQVGGMDITTPARIDSIPCTDPINKPNKLKLALPGYRDEKGILYITSSNTPTDPYPFNITMERAPNEIGGLLIAALTIGAFMFFLSRDKEKK